MSKKLKIKVCGMKNPANISSISLLGIDYMGFIFVKDSPRYISKIPEINLPDFISIKKVAVVKDLKLDEIKNILEGNSINVIQLHGNESPEFCNDLKKCFHGEIFKAFGVNDDTDFTEMEVYMESCTYFLFDTKVGKNSGGTGKKFNWEVLDNYKLNLPFFLAGGISAGDAIDIRKIKHEKFCGLDLNSGFEIKPGLKDSDKLKEFLQDLKQ
jgi:phosphoribosylanthranilate isomerase